MAVAEFTALRAEIVQLTGLQSQMITLTVVAFGAVLPVGLQARNAAIVLVYPLLALVLGIVWLYKAHLITRIAAYLRSGVEDRVGRHNLGWEHFVQQNPLPRGRFAYWGLRSIFPTTSILAIGASIAVATPSIALFVMYGLACIVTITSVMVFIVWREPAPELNPGRPRGRKAGGAFSPPASARAAVMAEHSEPPRSEPKVESRQLKLNTDTSTDNSTRTPTASQPTARLISPERER
ncbi:hypothetical protein [Nonomuraea sp. CA-141351]|uniref:hypothetical protein n=1 Tax=Nonomuraea sp. CA-141351 TaxID=3239996 RepID=UPI003D947E75